MRICTVYTAIAEVAKEQSFANVRAMLDRNAVDRNWHPAVCGAITMASMLGNDKLVQELESLLGWIAISDIPGGSH